MDSFSVLLSLFLVVQGLSERACRNRHLKFRDNALKSAPQNSNLCFVKLRLIIILDNLKFEFTTVGRCSLFSFSKVYLLTPISFIDPSPKIDFYNVPVDNLPEP